MAAEKQRHRGLPFLEDDADSDSPDEASAASHRFRWATCPIPSPPPPPKLSSSSSPPHSSSSSGWSQKRAAEEEEPEEEEVAPKKKISFGLKKPVKNGHRGEQAASAPEKKVTGISIKLGPQKSATTPAVLKPKSSKVAAVFNPDEEDEPEEMPPEARMRMRNIGRDTPTSAGPNSFGKTKQGFCDIKKMYEKQLKEAMESAAKEDHFLPE